MFRTVTAAVVFLLAGSGVRADVADQVRSSGVAGGIVVHVGCGDGSETLKARLDERFLVQGLDVDDKKVQAARKNILAARLYGTVTARRFDGKELPYVDNLVNLVIADDPGGLSRGEILRVLAPGGVAIIGGEKIVKPWPHDIDEWTHYLHGPDNNAVAEDRVAYKPRALQWKAGPLHGRSHEELASLSACVTANGRIFYITDQAPPAFIRFDAQWELVARDAFNGMPLWKKPIPLWSDHLRHFRAGPLHLPRRLVAVGDRVYVTLGIDAPVVEIDAATGEVLKTFEGTQRTEEISVSDGVLYLVVGTSEVFRTGGGLHARREPAPTSFRYIAAYDIGSGDRIWKHEDPQKGFILPLTMTVRGNSVFYQSTHGVAQLSAANGKTVWRTPRATAARRMSFSSPTVVATDEVLLVSDALATREAAAAEKVQWGVHGWSEPGFNRRLKHTLIAYSVEDGRELWSVPASEGYNSPVDIFVVGDEVWVGSDFKCYDLKTGKETKTIQWRGPNVGMPHHRCYRDKATERFIYTGRSGIEVVDLQKGCVGNNSWIRGTCQYGIMPANGLLYAPPHACACFAKVKLDGFCAVAHHRSGPSMEFSKTPALEKGPGFGKGVGQAGAEDWPMYRHDSRRSGIAGTTLPDSLEPCWSAKIGGRLTQAVAAAGRVFVASVDAHTVYALDAKDGASLWNFTAGGRIDSAPVYYKGYVLFGCADGWIYSVCASDGTLAWRFRAAPRERLAGVLDQLESVWPVHGAVQLQNGMLYAVAGRNSYLDGGMVLYRLDPLTGKELSRTPIYDINPETDIQKGGERGFDMEGVKTDLITGDGEKVYIKHKGFDREGAVTSRGDKPHLMCAAGVFDDQWFVRSYWLIGTNVGVGWGGWANVAAVVPQGRILCWDGEKTWGYGRIRIQSAATGHRADAYHLFCKEKPAAAPVVEEKPKSDGKAKKRRSAPSGPPAKLVWSQQDSLLVRAMVKVGDALVVAGPPDLGIKDSKVLQFKNEPEALAGFLGKKGVFLRVVSATDGEKMSECALHAMPVFDGMSAANGKIYLSLKNGVLECRGR